MKKNQSVAFFLFWDKNRLKKVREAAQNALVIQLQNYPKNIRRKYLLRWIFFYINTNALTKIMLLSSFWNCAYWIKSAIFTPELNLWWKLSKSLIWIFTLKTKVKYLNLSLEIQIMTSKKLKKYNCHGVRIWNAQRFYPNLSLQLFSECQKCKQIGRALNKTGVTQ